jgi:glutaredoxin
MKVPLLYTIRQAIQTLFDVEGLMSKSVILYMSSWCYQSRDLQRALGEWGVPYRSVNIKEDRRAAARLREWVGFESTPTVVIAEGSESWEPYEAPMPLPAGSSPRGVDRGSMLTEASREQLREWLVKHGLLEK